jgi:predicted nucleic acid-binding protein
MKLIFLDASPLSTLSDPRNSPSVIAITSWLISKVNSGVIVCIPEIVDYELRREMVRSNKTDSIIALNNLQSVCKYISTTTETYLLAADYWAQLRNSGLPTGDPKKIDIDVILCAQAATEARRLGLSSSEFIVATSNVDHIQRLVPADKWENII